MRKRDLLASVIPLAAYLEQPVRDRVLEMQGLLANAHEVASHQHNSNGEQHYDHIAGFAPTVVNHVREVIAASLRRKTMPQLSERIIEYLVALDATIVERGDIYAQEEQEYQADRAAWLGRRTDVTARIEHEKRRYADYLASEKDE